MFIVYRKINQENLFVSDILSDQQNRQIIFNSTYLIIFGVEILGKKIKKSENFKINKKLHNSGLFLDFYLVISKNKRNFLIKTYRNFGF